MKKILIEGVGYDRSDGTFHPPQYWGKKESSHDKHPGRRGLITITLIGLCIVGFSSGNPYAVVWSIIIAICLAIYIFVWTVELWTGKYQDVVDEYISTLEKIAEKIGYRRNGYYSQEEEIEVLKKYIDEHLNTDFVKGTVSCKCGKYNGERYKGVVCDICKTQV